MQAPATAENKKWLRIRVQFFTNLWLQIRIRVRKKQRIQPESTPTLRMRGHLSHTQPSAHIQWLRKRIFL